MQQQAIIGVDLGGTKVEAARVRGQSIVATKRRLVSSSGTEEQVLQEVIATIADVFEGPIAGIGIGVPGIVDVERGIVYDVQNIPSWKEVPLKQILEHRFGVPVLVNNDANCFAIGELYYGKGQAYSNLIGLIIGTGMAGGIVAQGKLYSGHNCGAGEFGMMPYLEHHYEYYCSGQFFTAVYDMEGGRLFEQAQKGNARALAIFSEYGTHLGNGIMAILYALDPEAIILGGSVSKAYPFFKESLWNRLQSFAYRPVLKRLTITVSESPGIAMFGAAALYHDAKKGKQGVPGAGG